MALYLNNYIYTIYGFVKKNKNLWIMPFIYILISSKLKKCY
jgi:hypothetical protein